MVMNDTSLKLFLNWNKQFVTKLAAYFSGIVHFIETIGTLPNRNDNGDGNVKMI